MNLYQRRDFGALFSDSFKFLKTHFKHLYGNFLRIIGLFTIGFLILLYIGSRYFEVFYKNFTETATYNIGSLPGGELMAIIVIALTVIMAILISAMVYSYTPIYFLLYRDRGTDFTNKDIIASYRQYKGRILKYLLVMLGLGIATILIVGALVGFLAMLMFKGGGFLIAIFFLLAIFAIMGLLIIVPYVTVSIHNGFLEYLTSEYGIMNCLRYGFTLTKGAFWKNVGSVLLYSLLVRIVMSIVLAIPLYIIMFGKMMTGINNAEAFMFTTLFWNYASQFISNYMIAPILQTNLSMVYFSNKEANEQMSSFNELDEIGTIQ